MVSFDNAAKIYPVVITIKESHVFRVSMTLKEEVNPEILQKRSRCAKTVSLLFTLK